MTIFNLISMLGGLSLFLYGTRVMGDGLKQGSSAALKNAMSLVTNNPFMGFLLGLAVTCVIQSSSATVFLTAGLVSAGIMTARQCVGVVIGAHLGTTVTGQIIRLLDLDAGSGGVSILNFFQPSTLAPLAAVIGIFLIMFARGSGAKTAGAIAMGFCILFTGLMNMTGSVSPLSESESFARMFANFGGKPVLGFGAGLLTALLFHSSASVGILQALSVTGSLSFGSIYAILPGIYLGDCLITGLMVSVGGSTGARKVGCIHILYCIGKDLVILAAVLLLRNAGIFGDFWTAKIGIGGIANVNTFYNLGAALVLLPASSLLYLLCCRLVEGEETVSKADAVSAALSRNLYSSPELALSAAAGVIEYISQSAADNVRRGFDAIGNWSEKLMEEIARTEDDMDILTDRVGEYLTGLSNSARTPSETNRLNYYVKVVSEFERIGDLADNVGENATTMHERKIVLTPAAQKELGVLREAIEEAMQHTHEAFRKLSKEEARYVEPIEEAVDDIIIRMKSNHYDRVQNGECTIFAGYVFLDILTNLERVSDQCANIAVHTIALDNMTVAEAEHDYIKKLHMGEDADFNEKFAYYTEKYTSRI